jgi:hypothetical protein
MFMLPSLVLAWEGTARLHSDHMARTVRQPAVSLAGSGTGHELVAMMAALF